MRQHVNPLSNFFQLPKKLPETFRCFKNDELPLHLDIGSARGKFLLELASINKDYNYIGVEIRESLVLASEEERKNLKLTNLKFLFCNANISLDDWLSNLRSHQLKRVSIQFPDPWFKRRHHKRRVLQPELLISLAKVLDENSEFFIQSDIFEVAESMKKIIDASDCFERQNNQSPLWKVNSPFSILTEREKYVNKLNMPIYRELYLRNRQNAPNLETLLYACQNLKN